MEPYFNSLDPNCRTPVGAIRVGEPVLFTLRLPHEDAKATPHLVLAADGKPAEHLPMQFADSNNGVDRFTIALCPKTAGLYFYYFDLYWDFRKLFRGPFGDAQLSWTQGSCYQLTVYDKDFKTPDAIKGSVIYQIFPDRFYEDKPHTSLPFADRVYRSNKDGEPYFWPTETGGDLNMDYFGGNFAGIQKKLPYLQELGVGWIYLNPIFEAHSNHRYNTADYLKADPLLGTNEEFAELCAEAKKYGIRIILDGVFSHTGADSIYFNKEGRYGRGGAYHDPNSPYRSWYEFSDRYHCGYRSWWGFDTLPEVNENDPGYREFICGKGGVVDTWLSLGASGFRLDVADELPDSFIEELRQAVKAHGEDKLLLGEVWEDATTKIAYDHRRTYLMGKGLDSVMNYPFRNAVLNFLKGGNVQESAETILSICENYPKPALDCLMNFMSTHDTERAMTELAGESCEGRDRYWQSGRRLDNYHYEQGILMLKLAYAMIFTLPGVPSIYYGDEIAMQGYKDPFNRAYYNWNSTEHRLRPVFRQLAELRRECDAFKDGRFELVCAEGDLLQYRRVGKTQTAEIVLNRGPKLLAVRALGQITEVNPFGFTILTDDN